MVRFELTGRDILLWIGVGVAIGLGVYKPLEYVVDHHLFTLLGSVGLFVVGVVGWRWFTRRGRMKSVVVPKRG